MGPAGATPPLELHGIGPQERGPVVRRQGEREKRQSTYPSTPTSPKQENWFTAWIVNLVVADNDG